LRTTTLQELGPRFPIGFVANAGLEKAFQLRPYKGKIDRLLGLWKQANGQKYSEDSMMTRMVAKLVSLLCEQAGSRANAFDENGDSTPATELWVHQWNLADVIYMYVYARVQALGTSLQVPCMCENPKCKKTSVGDFDLNTLEVRVAESVEDTFMWYDLKEPIQSRDGKKILSFKIEPIKWATLTKPGIVGSMDAEIDIVSLQDSIIAINKHLKTTHNGETLDGIPYQVVPSEIDELGKADLTILNKQVAEMSLGIDVHTEVTCPHCAYPIFNPLNWDYSYFFGTSFQPET